MFGKFKGFLNEYKFVLLLLALNIAIVVANFPPNHWLSGWDNLHPEFNFGININRVFFSAWEEFQGLGLPSGMAHASDLPRLLIMWILSFILPLNSLRIVWQFLMLLVGSIGFYFFIKEFVFYRLENTNTDLYAFLGASFYLLNLGMLQNFYAPQSMFTTQYGYLPWLFMFGFGYLFNSRKFSLFWYCVVSFLASTQAYTPTLILAYFLFLGIAVLYFVVVNRFRKEVLIKSLILLLVTFAANAYWLAPFVYYLPTIAGTVQRASINVFSSDESFLLNKEYGSFDNIAILRSFWFGNTDYNISRGTFSPMFNPWISHIESGVVLYVGYFLFTVVMLGVLSLIFHKSIKNKILYLLFIATSIFFLRNANPPFGNVFMFLQEYLPLFKEALRFPFTKFSILTTFSYAIFFTLGIAFLGKIVKESKAVLFSLSVILVSSLVFWMFPLFQGSLFSSNLIVEYPDSYFEMFEWFETQDSSSRILNLPMATYWAWPYYDWGYRGSGFLWYGLKQPILDRAFDVWHPKNEEAYWQISQAIYSNNTSNLKSMLEKYDIRWLLVDKSIIVPANPNQEEVLNLAKTFELLDSDNDFTKTFASGNLSVYEYSEYDKFVELYPNETPKFQRISDYRDIKKFDSYYSQAGDYILEDSGREALFGDLGKRDLEFEVRDSVDFLTLSTNIKDTGGGFVIPSHLEFKDPTPVKIDIVSPTSIRVSTVPVEVSLNGNTVYSGSSNYEIDVPTLFTGDVVSIGNVNFEVTNIPDELGSLYLDFSKDIEVEIYRSSNITIDISELLNSATVASCSLELAGSYSLERMPGGLKLDTLNNTACISQNIENSSLSQADLVGVFFNYNSRNTYPKFCLYDGSNKRCINDETKYSNLEIQSGNISEFVEIPDNSANFIWHFYAEAAAGVRSTVEYSGASLNLYSSVYKNLFSSENFGSIENTYAQLVEGSENIVTLRFPLLSNSGLVSMEDFSNKQFSYNDACFYEKLSTPDVENNKLVLRTQTGESCLYLQYPSLPQKYNYLIKFDHKRDSGSNQEMCVIDYASSRCVVPYKVTAQDSEWQNHQLLIPEGDVERLGYSIIIHNISIADEPTINYYDSLKVMPIPIDWLRNIFLADRESLLVKNVTPINIPDFESNIFWYKIPQVQPGFLKLSQVYDPGWVAFCGVTPCGQHTIFSGWANVWEIEKPSSVTIVYLPQIVQLLGYLFGFFVVTVLFLHEKTTNP